MAEHTDDYPDSYLLPYKALRLLPCKSLYFLPHYMALEQFALFSLAIPFTVI